MKNVTWLLALADCLAESKKLQMASCFEKNANQFYNF